MNLVYEMNWFTTHIILLTLISMTSGACSNCEKCVLDKCKNSANNQCACEQGCKPGYYGNKCLNDCPEQCYTCGREYGVPSHPTYRICYECKTGYHNGSSTNCSCPINCQECTSTTQCTMCYQGWYGTMCQSSCPTNCKSQMCDKDDGSCNNGCNDGWFGTECHQECSDTCKGSICQQDDGICDNCTPGKYGSNCNADCPSSNCLNNECDRDDGICTNGCTGNFALGTNNLCQTCKPGKYGSNCNTDCPSSNCLNNECDRDDGICTNGCTGNFALGTNNLCQTCKAGKYGSNCNTDCPSSNCLNNECDRDDGICTNGCTGNFALGTNNLCQTCKPGKYGSNCNTDCPSSNCVNNECDLNNGLCNNGCNIGWYFTSCDKVCPTADVCKDEKCRQNDGVCIECISGKYGPNCNTDCPSSNCLNNECDRTSGLCTNGCTGNFALGTNNLCQTCKPGKYGPNCNTDCPSSNCLNNECDRTSGLCTNGCTGNFALGTNNLCQTCKAGKYGSNCNTDCLSSNCLNNECDRNNGSCNNGCIKGWYNTSCDMVCPTADFCKDNECRQSDGVCIKCIFGKYGFNCSTDCPSRNCLNNKCDRNNGSCTNGCMTGHYDDLCNSNCSTNCLDDVCNQITGKCGSCETGFHGKTCQYECSKNCINETCSQDDAECFHGCTNGFHGQTCQQALRDEDKEENNIVGPVAGSVAGFVVIVIGVMAFLMFRKWKGNKDKNPSNALSSSNDDLRTAATDRRDDNVYQNDRLNRMVDPVEIDIEDNEDQLADGNDVDAEYANAPLSTTKIRIMDLYTFVTQTEYEHFKTEFGRLPRSALHSYECAKKSENRALNRFRGIYPYDHSRVKLKHDPTFFINACYIDGYNRDKAYIASVGPTAAITNGYISFWTMVWYENVDKIVILTKLQEETGMKCERYWPFDGESKVYGDITVSHQEINVYAEYTITTLLLEKTNQQRYIKHIHYTAWPDKTIPDNVVSLVEFYNRVKSIKSNSGGPTIVHCSAGIGRTGTFIALDKLTEQGRSEQSVNVYECVMGLRDQRMKMVQTHEQYEYLHRCITYTLTFGSDPVTTDYVQSKLSTLDDRMYTKQFKMFDHDVERKSLDELQAIEANKQFKDKNRPGADIPGNRDRPRLYLNRSFNGPDYINAVYIDSFKKTNRYIVAQTPLPETLSDFLCLLYQSNCSCIVDMNGPELHNKNNIGVYQPEENQSFDVDSYTISCSNSETNSSFIKSILKLKNSSKQNPGEISITHYQYTGWKQNTDVPDSVNNFVQFVNSAQVSTDSLNEESPMIIHCLNGYERSGLFCTTSIMLEKLECEQQISIGNTIRQVRLRRNKAIPNEAQYKFCIQCAAAFTNMFNTYSNFAM